MIKKIILQLENITPPKYQWIFSHQGFFRYFKNTGWMLLGQAMSLIVSFFVGVWLARYLGPSHYGVVNYTIAFVGLFGMIANLGIDHILQRELVKYPEKKEELLGTAFYLKLIGAFLAILFILIISFIIKFDPLHRLYIILFSVSFIFQSLNVITSWFQSQVMAKKNVLANVFALILSAILKVLFILFKLDLFYLILIYTLDTLWISLALFYIYKKNGFILKKWSFNKLLAKSLFYDSWPLILAGTASFIYMRIDQVMIGHFKDEAAVGIYAAAIKFGEVWYFLPTLICASLFPAIINARQSNFLVYKQRLKNLIILMALLALFIAIPTALLAPFIIPLLFGLEYIASISILQIYIWSGIGLFVGIALSQYLIAENLTKKLFVLNLLAMILNISLNFILIPRLGIAGAAITTLVSFLFLPLYMLFEYMFKKRKV